MRSLLFRSASPAAFAVLAFAGSAPAQGSSPALLNTLEVRQLAARAEPGDNARLASHFTAVADRYAAEAQRHTSMSQSFGGNPSRTLGTGMSAHCKRLADLNTQSATTARELATHHRKLAEGAPSTPPKDAARFEGGAGARQPTEKELTALAAKARTPSEHGALQEYFQTLAKQYTDEADEHTRLAQTYRGTRIAQAAVHHDRLATLARDAAKEASAGADMHRAQATGAR